MDHSHQSFNNCDIKFTFPSMISIAVIGLIIGFTYQTGSELSKVFLGTVDKKATSTTIPNS